MRWNTVTKVSWVAVVAVVMLMLAFVPPAEEPGSPGPLRTVSGAALLGMVQFTGRRQGVGTWATDGWCQRVSPKLSREQN